MPKVRTKIVPPGTHVPRDGKPFHVDRSRVKHWVETFRRMKAAGIKVPVAWGHQPQAVPADEKAAQADREYWLSRYNAGYVEDLDVGPDGALEGVVDVPGARLTEDGKLETVAHLPDGRQVPCAISEVSAAVRDWRDGRGNPWKDSIIHVALTPLPVVAGQEGFRPLPEAPPAEGEVRLSLATLLSTDTEDTDMPDGTSAPTGGGGDFNKLLELLATVANLHMPEGTTPENFVERLTTVLNHEHQSTGGGEEEGGSDGGATLPPTEEAPPTVMSLATISDPVQQVLFRRLESEHRGKLAQRVERLARAQWPNGLPVFARATIDKLRSQASQVNLSLAPTGEPQESELERQLSLLESALPDPAQAALLSRAQEAAPPTQAPDQVDEVALKDRLKKLGFRVKGD